MEDYKVKYDPVAGWQTFTGMIFGNMIVIAK